MATRALSLKECAERLGVHYMTAYRYVRIGMLPAEKVGAEWQVAEEDLDAFRRGRSAGAAVSGRRREAPWAERLKRRLVAGDERGSWQVVESALSSGLDPTGVYVDLISPAMRSIGDDWASGRSSIAEEHRATAVATRLIGRLGARFGHRGRSRGTVVVGTPAGEAHGLAVAIVADLFRNAGFDAVDLGCDLPAESFVEAVVRAEPVSAIAVSVSTATSLPAAEHLIAALREVTAAPILIGGGAVEGEEHARSVGADGFAEDGPAAVRFTEGLGGSGRKKVRS